MRAFAQGLCNTETASGKIAASHQAAIRPFTTCRVPATGIRSPADHAVCPNLIARPLVFEQTASSYNSENSLQVFPVLFVVADERFNNNQQDKQNDYENHQISPFGRTS